MGLPIAVGALAAIAAGASAFAQGISDPGERAFQYCFSCHSVEPNQTEVVAERMIRWFFISGHDGRGAAIAVVLFLAVIPVMLWNVRRFREQEAIR